MNTSPSSLPGTVLLQTPSTHETRAVVVAATLANLTIQRLSLDDMYYAGVKLRAGALPVGSVEFVRAAMLRAGIEEPASTSYPGSVAHLMRRAVRRTTLDQVSGRQFIKPVQTKRFNGFVIDRSLGAAALDDHDQVQLAVVDALPGTTEVWACEPVRFVCEWRYYVLDGRILGAGRYDPDGDIGAAAPDGATVRHAMDALAGSSEVGVAYALDVGVLESGETAIVEVNDAWATGLYGAALSQKDYLCFLAARWAELLAAVDRYQPSESGASARRKEATCTSR